MTNIEDLAVKIGKRSKDVLHIDEDKEQVVTYGAIMVLHSLISIFMVTVFGILFGVFYEALLFSVVVSRVRKYSGGVHSSSPSRCILVGTTSSIVSALVINKFFCKLNIVIVLILSIICLVVSFSIIFRKAPVDSIKKPITNIEIKKKFKKDSIIVILAFSVLVLILFVLYINYSKGYYIKAIECISFAIIWQSITLTELGIRAHNKVDCFLKYIMEGGGK